MTGTLQTRCSLAVYQLCRLVHKVLNVYQLRQLFAQADGGAPPHRCQSQAGRPAHAAGHKHADQPYHLACSGTCCQRATPQWTAALVALSHDADPGGGCGGVAAGGRRPGPGGLGSLGAVLGREAAAAARAAEHPCHLARDLQVPRITTVGLSVQGLRGTAFGKSIKTDTEQAANGSDEHGASGDSLRCRTSRTGRRRSTQPRSFGSSSMCASGRSSW